MRTRQWHSPRVLGVALLAVSLLVTGMVTVDHQQRPQNASAALRLPSTAPTPSAAPTATATLAPPATPIPPARQTPSAAGPNTTAVTPLPGIPVQTDPGPGSGAVAAQQAAPSDRFGTPSSGYDRYHGPNYTDRVLLSFDDCPQSLTKLRHALDWLSANDVGVVLFPTGRCVSSFVHRYGTTITMLMRAHGQYVGNHSISHPRLTRLSYAGVALQLGPPGVVTNYGRPPYGAVSPTVDRVYAAKGIHEVLWTVDSRDWTGKTAAQVARYVTAKSRPRSLVLMHMSWNGFYPATLAQIRAGLTRKGLGLCRRYPGTTPVRAPDRLPC